MALVLGTNCGFVTETPTGDPNETDLSVDNYSWNFKATSPSNVVKITEIGWYCNVATDNRNFEVGLYAADGGVVPGEAGTRLYVDTTNAKGTTLGWKTVTVDWEINADTIYWLAVQLDSSTTDTTSDYNSSGGAGVDRSSSGATNLPDPFGGGALILPNALIAIYAIAEAVAGTNISINIADTFKDVDSLQINIGDVWKDVTQVQQNIGDVWKTVF